MKVTITHIARVILLAIITFASAVLCYQIISNTIVNQKNKNDYAELNHVKYGLLSVEEWKRQVTAILSEEIDDMYLATTNEPEFRHRVEVLLSTLIEGIDQKIREENSKTMEGKVKQYFINIFVSLDEIKRGIPKYADAVIHELQDAKTRRDIKTIIKRQIDNYSAQTFDKQDTSRLDRILAKRESGDIEGAKSKISEEISDRNYLIARDTILLIILSVITFAFAGLGRKPLSPATYTCLVLFLIILLAGGISAPMIDMEAKISHMGFSLLGHPVSFENQVLYFKSKSILDVFLIMINHEDIQMKFVGALLITFSIIFPLLKIFSSTGYYYHHRLRNNPAIRFFVFKSGKWSMADVMVVAIFMAYFGLNGIVTNQLDKLDTVDTDLVLLTTNGTSLQPGYYLFLTYTLLALFFSGFLSRKTMPSNES